MAVQAQFPLCGSQDWIDNGCGVGLNNNFYYTYLHQQQQPQIQQQQCNLQLFQSQNQHLKNQNHAFNTTMPYPQTMASFEETQRQDLDHYIRLQNERLRLLLQEQRKHQIASLMKIIESKALPLLRKKDEEIAEAAKRRTELADFLKRLEMENQAWQRVAQENEAMAVSLNNRIEQLKEKTKTSSWFDNGAEDAESCCDIMNREEETGQRNRVFAVEDYNNNNNNNIVTEEEGKKKKKKMMVCKGCNSRNSCILFLPCRHLCSCKACEAFLDSCPVCLTEKKASIEALIV